MDVKILSETEHPLLNRKQVIAEISHPGQATPLRKEMVMALAETLGSPGSLIIVDKIFTHKGSPSCEARALVYAKEDQIPPASREKHQRRLEGKKAGKAEAKEEKKESKEQKK